MDPISKRCRLLELPVELQLQIWGLVIFEDKPLLLNMSCNSSYRERYEIMYEHGAAWASGEMHPPLQPAITQTCRAIRTEALPMFYRDNVFRACYCDTQNMLPPVVGWLNQIGPENRESLKHFYFYDRNHRQDYYNPKVLEELRKCAVFTEMHGSIENKSGKDCCCHLVTFGESRRNGKDGLLPALEPGVPRLRLVGEV